MALTIIVVMIGCAILFGIGYMSIRLLEHLEEKRLIKESRPIKYCIMFVHSHGGSKSVCSDTRDLVLIEAARVSTKHPTSYIMATLPYKTYLAKGSKAIFDCSVPKDIRKQWGKEIETLYTGE